MSYIVEKKKKHQYAEQKRYYFVIKQINGLIERSSVYNVLALNWLKEIVKCGCLVPTSKRTNKKRSDNNVQGISNNSY